MPTITETLSDGRVVEYKTRNPPTALAATSPRRGRNRRSKRGRRGGRNKGRKRSSPQSSGILVPAPIAGSNKMMPWVAGSGRVGIPHNISSNNMGRQFFQANGPAMKHKEWGAGSRFVGRSVIGGINYTSGLYQVFYPIIPMNDATAYTYNLYDIVAKIRGKVFPLHPGLYSRIGTECINWDRYAYRKLRVVIEGIGNTDTNNAYVAGIGHNPSLPFTVGWANNGWFPIANILGLEQSCAASQYQMSSLQARDYNGDRTWPTTIPQAPINTVFSDLTDGADIVENYYPYFFAMSNPTTVATAAPMGGFVHLEYVIDFYGSAVEGGGYISKNASTTTSPSPSSVSSSSSSVGTSSVEDSLPHGDLKTLDCGDVQSDSSELPVFNPQLLRTKLIREVTRSASPGRKFSKDLLTFGRPRPIIRRENLSDTSA